MGSKNTGLICTLLINWRSPSLPRVTVRGQHTKTTSLHGGCKQWEFPRRSKPFCWILNFTCFTFKMVYTENCFYSKKPKKFSKHATTWYLHVYILGRKFNLSFSLNIIYMLNSWNRLSYVDVHKHASSMSRTRYTVNMKFIHTARTYANNNRNMLCHMHWQHCAQQEKWPKAHKINTQNSLGI